MGIVIWIVLTDPMGERRRAYMINQESIRRALPFGGHHL